MTNLTIERLEELNKSLAWTYSSAGGDLVKNQEEYEQAYLDIRALITAEIDRSKGERMHEAMIRFNLVNGDSYTLLGDEAVDAWRSSDDDGFRFKFEDKIVRLYERHIVSIERRGVEE